MQKVLIIGLVKCVHFAVKQRPCEDFFNITVHLAFFSGFFAPASSTSNNMSRTVPRNGAPRRQDEEDGRRFPPSTERGIHVNRQRPHRYLPSMQVLTVSQPQHAFPGEPGVLPQDVRVLCRPDILSGPSVVPCCWVQSHFAETTV